MIVDQLQAFAETQPEKPAVIVSDSGQSISYRELDLLSNRIAQLLLKRGLVDGDGIAVIIKNGPRYLPIVIAARRAGMSFTPISTHLTEDEAAYIVKDCGAKLCFVDLAFPPLIERLSGLGHEVVGVDADGGDPLDAALAEVPDYAALPSDVPGGDFFYSSGTTGKPKGVRRPRDPAGTGLHSRLFDSAGATWGFGSDMVFLSPGPLYHAAPLRFVVQTIAEGGTVVIMPRFDALGALEAMARYRTTHSQWVPTMFHRLLALPDETRTGFDLSAHRFAIHAAAPCPIPLKERMIAWWGAIVWEYYAATEGNGLTTITTEEWMAHKGSVGRPMFGVLHIVDDDGRECGPQEVGDVYFDGTSFGYHNDPEKTAACYNAQGWSTVGDVGYVDADGYLYLTDRRSHMIISGGVNIYPAEIENALSEHPAVHDVAVFGIPNEEFGEEVKAAVAIRPGIPVGPALEAELIAFCRDQLASLKCPKSVDFHDELPRQESGKLFKKVLRAAYLKT